MSAAGDKPYYIINGEKYVRVTKVIGDVMAKPALPGWAYRATRDAIAGMVAVHLEADEAHPDSTDLLDVLKDADELEAYLKANRLRPEDQTKDAMARGTAVHAKLEQLANLSISEGPGTAHDAAQRMVTNKSPLASPWDPAVGQFWIDHEPEVVASEIQLHSEKEKFAGTTDLLWTDGHGNTHCTDLKSRGEGGYAYDSDFVQGDAYDIAWKEMYPLQLPMDVIDVLVARPDGTYDLTPSPYARGIFLLVLSLYRALGKGV